MSRRFYQVKEMAKASGITVRTLHHYDAIGLLRPSARSDAGYRLYDHRDVLRLQQIMLHRELGFSLEEIRRILDDPGFDLHDALVRQREEIESRIEREHALLGAIDEALRTLDGDRAMEAQTMKEIFDGFDPSIHEAEAKERWGNTPAWTEANQRTRGYGEHEWRQLKEESDAIMRELAEAMERGEPHDSPAVDALAERHRLHIDRWFYPCDRNMHANLADLYDGDPRFAANIDRHREGLSGFLAKAVRARRSG